MLVDRMSYQAHHCMQLVKTIESLCYLSSGLWKTQTQLIANLRTVGV